MEAEKQELISFLQILDDPRVSFGMNAATTLKRAKTTARRAKDIFFFVAFGSAKETATRGSEAFFFENHTFVIRLNKFMSS